MSLNDLIAELAELEKARMGESELEPDLDPEPLQEPELEPRTAKKIKQTARQRRLRAETPRPAAVARTERVIDASGPLGTPSHDTLARYGLATPRPGSWRRRQRRR
jgi:hypothetical protein